MTRPAIPDLPDEHGFESEAAELARKHDAELSAWIAGLAGFIAGAIFTAVIFAAGVF